MVNDSNFLIWSNSVESPFATELPRPFVREPEVLSPVVWFVAGDVVSFYINTTDNTSIGGQLQFVDETGAAHDLINAATSSIDFPGGSHSYGSFTVPAGLAEGFVRLKLGNYLTQHCYYASAERASHVTAIVRFRNGDRLFNTRWRYLPSDFSIQMRIRLAMKSEEPELNKTTYRTSTTGKTRNLYSEPRQIITFMAPEYDRNGHRAIVNMMEHDTLFINGNPYAFATAYKTNSTEGDRLTTGEFGLSDENYATLHRS